MLVVRQRYILVGKIEVKKNNAENYSNKKFLENSNIKIKSHLCSSKNSNIKLETKSNLNVDHKSISSKNYNSSISNVYFDDVLNCAFSEYERN